MSSLLSISPLDGRYYKKVEQLRNYFSEHALMYYRTYVEVHWLIALCDHQALDDIPSLSSTARTHLHAILEHFDEESSATIKHIESTTNHDVKAVEYFLQQQMKDSEELAALIPWIHFACTSEDINNLSYALMLKDARNDVLLPQLESLISALTHMATAHASLPMLSRTHGQAASPTTLGKEVANITYRLKRQCAGLKNTPLLGKINGATGNFNAHYAAYPNVDWSALSQAFILSLQLEPNPLTTQIEPHDFIAEYCHHLSRVNTILIDASRDIWGYISLGYFKQKLRENEVGSSTMPHKVNPIDFENAEGNAGIANALLTHFAEKLPLSRWQRDLTDSTVLRNLGVALGHCQLSLSSFSRGLEKLTPSPDALSNDLNAHCEVLAEAVQTVMRRYGYTDAYEQLKAFSRGQALTLSALQQFIDQLKLPDDVKHALRELTPARYIGNAAEQVKQLL